MNVAATRAFNPNETALVGIYEISKLLASPDSYCGAKPRNFLRHCRTIQMGQILPCRRRLRWGSLYFDSGN